MHRKDAIQRLLYVILEKVMQPGRVIDFENALTLLLLQISSLLEL